MKKEVKTNAMRLLDKAKINYTVESYEADEFIDGLHVADILNHPYECSFKTLVCVSKSKQYYVFCLPIHQELDLKKAAKLTNEKYLELIHVRDLLNVTGYVRGGCTPIGMKKNYPVFIHESALNYDKIYISGGKVGTTLCLNAFDLNKMIRIHFENIVIEG